MIIPNAKWLHPNTAPKDGTMVLLLVCFSENSTEDTTTAITIGSNAFENTGVEDWQFAGWDWSYDEFTQGYGEVIGWWPILTPEIPNED